MSRHIPIVLPPFKLDAILQNGATQLRVPITPQPPAHLDAFYPPSKFRKGFEFYHQTLRNEPEPETRKYPEVHCPYGRRGDLLYVQEEWSTIGATSQDIILKAATPVGLFSDRNKNTPWQPPETMPKQAARYWLRVADVAVERAQTINKSDAWAEGPTRLPELDQPGFGPACLNVFQKNAIGTPFCLGVRIAYQQWWKAVYGPGSWDANPWAFVIQFKLVDSPFKRPLATSVERLSNYDY